MYTPEQKKLIKHARAKVKNLFAQNPVPAHNFDHAKRVSKWAVQIAKAEKANVFLSELTAVLHDIGRVPEHAPGNTKAHHELSYELCREWFREDKEFDVLSKKDKLQILYALRYHYNDAADKYPVAWILRDADKLDLFGNIGLKRTLIFYKDDQAKIELDLRLRYHALGNLRSKTAKRIIQQRKLFTPAQKYLAALLQKKIKPVEL